MQEIKVKVYSLNELDERARNKAHENYLKTLDIETSEFWDTAEAFEKVFPISKVGDFFNPKYTEQVGALKGARLMAYLWNNYKFDLFVGKYYEVKTDERIIHPRVKAFPHSKGWDNYYYSAITLSTTGVLTGLCYDDDMLKPVYAALEGKFEGTFEEMLIACYKELDAAWYRECEYRQSYEYFDSESICSLFFKDGTLYE